MFLISIRITTIVTFIIIILILRFISFSLFINYKRVQYKKYKLYCIVYLKTNNVLCKIMFIYIYIKFLIPILYRLINLKITVEFYNISYTQPGYRLYKIMMRYRRTQHTRNKLYYDKSIFFSLNNIKAIARHARTHNIVFLIWHNP